MLIGHQEQKANHTFKRKALLVAIIVVIIMSTWVRINSIRIMGYNCAPHDLGVFNTDAPEDEAQYKGHLGYIYYLYYYGHLPTMDPRDNECFYNPPLFYSVEAVFWRLLESVGLSIHAIAEALQWVTLLCATIAVMAMILTLYKLKVRGLPLLFMTILISFHPEFTSLALSLNPDAMAMMFTALIVLLSLWWYQKPGYFKILLLALCYGLGMLTKLSVVLIAPATAFLFLLAFVQEKAENDFVSRKKLALEYVLFLVISVPIGMFWSIRNFLQYGMSFTYIPEMSYIEWLNIPQQSQGLLKRLGFPAMALWREVHFSETPDLEYNIWVQTFKTALVDEKYLVCTSTYWNLFLHLVLFASVMLAVFLNVAFIVMLLKKGTYTRPIKVFLVLIYSVVLLQYIKFCFDYPQTCTMSFRYIPIVLLFPALGGNFAWDHLKKHPFGKLLLILLSVLILFFAAGSAFLYLWQLNPVM